MKYKIFLIINMKILFQFLSNTVQLDTDNHCITTKYTILFNVCSFLQSDVKKGAIFSKFEFK